MAAAGRLFARNTNKNNNNVLFMVKVRCRTRWPCRYVFFSRLFLSTFIFTVDKLVLRSLFLSFHQLVSITGQVGGWVGGGLGKQSNPRLVFYILSVVENEGRAVLQGILKKFHKTPIISSFFRVSCLSSTHLFLPPPLPLPLHSLLSLRPPRPAILASRKRFISGE